ncbi:MAG TPA: DUF1292 domain-containing protein [Clostridiales bacterium]|jgi:hypothetical protein|nr:DUF1292 domain-containing protein [Clostridiales bacterium]
MSKNDEYVVDLMPEDNAEIITLYDEEENEIPFYQIACVEYNNEFYAMLQPAVEVEGIEEDEVIVLKMLEAKDDEDDLFEPVTDEKLLDEIYQAYIKAVEEEEEEYDAEDEDEEDEE